MHLRLYILLLAYAGLAGCGQNQSNVEKGNANGVLDGDLDEFVEASLAARVGAQRNA